MYHLPAVFTRRCFGCKKPIEASGAGEAQCYHLQTNDGRAWHAECLNCSWCKCPLFNTKSGLSSRCYTRGGQVYCPTDYFRFSPLMNEIKTIPKCLSCQQPIKTGEQVIHSPLHTFHIHCFSCDVCGKDLLPGQPYTLHANYPVCLEDDLRIRRANQMEPCLQLPYSPSQAFIRRKRVRTSFNEQQQHSMQAFFAQNQNPNANDLMSLSEETGLAKRVLQVWFQNARAKHRRIGGGSDRNTTISSVEECE
ncbi:LIM/homeobox protein Awh [Echinococcus granulosus]|uniref:LIM/homeobox protein Awh n=1 Tax=Echinococcus granulosus TaxID=6210 RepID=W6UB73_ECHGR|nr:LIM/homeobox protein Awh [Echinococcus granulosus]EUB58345.1 LIM/homeobox protein Awh [Echinococcus granulosus]